MAGSVDARLGVGNAANSPRRPTVLTYLGTGGHPLCSAAMVLRTARAGSLLLLLLTAAPVRADIYSFTDEHGVTHLTNVPSDSRYKILLRNAPAVSEAGRPINPALLARSAQYDPIIESASA